MKHIKTYESQHNYISHIDSETMYILLKNKKLDNEFNIENFTTKINELIHNEFKYKYNNSFSQEDSKLSVEKVTNNWYSIKFKTPDYIWEIYLTPLEDEYYIIKYYIIHRYNINIHLDKALILLIDGSDNLLPTIKNMIEENKTFTIDKLLSRYKNIKENKKYTKINNDNESEEMSEYFYDAGTYHSQEINGNKFENFTTKEINILKKILNNISKNNYISDFNGNEIQEIPNTYTINICLQKEITNKNYKETYPGSRYRFPSADFSIIKDCDEWYYVYINFDEEYYKCDQFEGLIDFLDRCLIYIQRYPHRFI